jgi:hypothetical protein
VSPARATRKMQSPVPAQPAQERDFGLGWMEVFILRVFDPGMRSESRLTADPQMSSLRLRACGETLCLQAGINVFKKNVWLLRTAAWVGLVLSIQTARCAPPVAFEVKGSYVHPGSGIVLPESLPGFLRVALTRYDRDGMDVGAGYNSVNERRRIAATVYVYPSPAVRTFWSAADIVQEAQIHETEAEFQRCKWEIQHSHPVARLIEEAVFVRTNGIVTMSGRRVVFEFEDRFGGVKTKVRSHLYIFCFVGGKWTVKYRFTHPRDLEAETDLEAFIRDWIWFPEKRRVK